MKYSIIILLITLIFKQSCSGQTKAKISDVDFHLEDRYIVVNYNLFGALPKEQLTIELTFITENNETIIPKTVHNDVGTNIFTDGSKVILWDIVADQVILSGSIKAKVTITSSKILFRGPSNALLSILIPGLGGYFVDTHKARSVLTTISTVGLLTFGIAQKIQADKYYTDYTTTTVNTLKQGLYNKYNDAHNNYLVTTKIAAGIWIFDVIYVTIKGARNKNLANSSYQGYIEDGPRLYYVNNGLQLGYSVSF